MKKNFPLSWLMCGPLALLGTQTIFRNNNVVVSATDMADQTCSADDESCQANLEEEEEVEDGLPGTPNPDCVDNHDDCEQWASTGECKVNPNYMLYNCMKSCLTCQTRIYSEQELEVGLDLGVEQVLEFEALKPEDTINKIVEAREFIKNEPDMLPNVKQICQNKHEKCSVWAVMGECESNKKYMDKHCTASCQSCIMNTREGRCPIDPHAPNAWEKEGDLDAMFIRLTQEPYLSKYDVKILSSPDGDNKTILEGPWVITMENVLSKEEAETLIRLGGEEGYKRSSDVGKLNADGTHERKVNEGRTSSNAWCQNACWKDPTSQTVAQRLADITGIPDVNSEYLQLLQYEPGQHYQAHHDYIPHHIRRQQGVRILTMYLYLNEVEAGGGTNFDLLNVTVMPKTGRALLWPSVLNESPNEKDPRTSHQALPVEAGTKYGANAWFHMRDFKNVFKVGCD